ncbi:MAG: TIGR04283 family arsenosugar biosynthesis glycosyltransferase [Bacteroidota bacterium]|nr:TIGR04283 family arsenosugar biosynthesis glycosyltransferase [Bacteroidota bacterium]
MVSIIIPTLNEEAVISKTLSHVMGQEGSWEIIVSDGGSTDRTTEIIQKFPNIRLVKSSKGRALQMNDGARFARGEILLFLHADTFLMPSAILKVENAMKNSSIVGGSFFLKFDVESPTFKIYSFLSKINHLLFTYGDQAIFVKKEIFKALKGYKNIALMEDVELQQRIRKRGKFVKLHQPVITSSRRFIRRGVIIQQVQNFVLVTLYLFGISPTILKKYYLNEGE